MYDLKCQIPLFVEGYLIILLTMLQKFELFKMNSSQFRLAAAGI